MKWFSLLLYVCGIILFGLGTNADPFNVHLMLTGMFTVLSAIYVRQVDLK